MSAEGTGADTDGGWPRLRTSFVGRADEIAAAVALLAEGVRLLTFVGPGGIGKTRLALAVVARLDATVTGGPAYVALAAVRDPALVLPTIAEAVGARVDERGPLAGIVERIGVGRRLLLLDNVEWLLAAGGDLERLREACPGVRLLVTSRVPLRLTEERLLEVGPLPLPLADAATDAVAIRSNPAVRLFLDRAQAAQPEFAASEGDLRAIATICRRLEGIPLAIELAAARVTVLPPAAMLGRLERRLPLLVGRDKDVPDRLRTMRGAIAWSYDLLDEKEQALFRRLSVFAGGFLLTEAEAIARGCAPEDGYPFAGGQNIYGQAWEAQQGKEPPQTSDGEWVPPALARLNVAMVDGLQTLFEHRLLRSLDPVEDDARFEMLETIREFGREELERTGEDLAADHAHAALVLARTEAAGWGIWGRDRRSWLTRLEADLGNVRAVFAWVATQPPPANQIALRMVDALTGFWVTRGLVGEGRALFDAALARPGGTVAARAMAAYNAGYLALIQGEDRRAASLIEESLRVCRRIGYRTGEARCRFFRALIAWRAGDRKRMAREARAALALYAEAKEHVGMAISLIALAVVARERGAFGEAAQLLKDASVPCEEWGFDWGLATCAYYEGELARARGDDGRAAARLQDGLRIYREQGDTVGMGGCLSGLASLAAKQDDLERAARLFAAAGKLSEAAPAFLPPSELGGYWAAAAAVREQLGDAAFYAASAVGYAMPIEHVVAEAELVEGSPAPRRSRQIRPTEAPTAQSLGLTADQFEVLRLLVRGLTVAQITAQLTRSQSSIYGRIERMKDRLRVTSDAELIAFAIDHGVG